MMHIFVYEHATASGAGVGSEPAPAPSLVAEGRAMFEAVVADWRALPGVCVLTVHAADETAFRSAARAADFSQVIAPETDGILETRSRWVEESGGRLLGPSPSAVRLTTDKLALARHLRAAGVPTPRTWPLGDEPAAAYPIVRKPRDGAGSQDTFLVAAPRSRVRRNPGAPPNADDLGCGAAIAQEYVPGFAASVAFLIGPRDCVGLAPCAQRLSEEGRFQYLGGWLPLPNDLADRATSLALRALEAVPGLLGYVGVDLVLGGERAADRIIEINPRLTTSYVGLRRLAAFNIADTMLRIARGEPRPPLRWRAGRVEFAADGTSVANPYC